MDDKDLKHLSRSELVDLIYTLRSRLDELERENSQLAERLQDRDIKIANAGSIAEASLALTNVFEEAQKAADIYLSQVRRASCDDQAPLSKGEAA